MVPNKSRDSVMVRASFVTQLRAAATQSGTVCIERDHSTTQAVPVVAAANSSCHCGSVSPSPSISSSVAVKSPSSVWPVSSANADVPFEGEEFVAMCGERGVGHDQERRRYT